MKKSIKWTPDQEKVIELIKKYADIKNTSTMGGLESSIQSVLGGFDLKL